MIILFRSERCDRIRRMTKATKSLISGNRGEAFVSFVLSRYCLVRPVASGTDIGIDLYCESILGDTPSTHFWVQVKTFKVKRKSITIENNYLEYWMRQPVPSFIFIVHDTGQLDESNFSLGAVVLNELLRGNHLAEGGKTKVPVFVTLTQDKLREFILEAIPQIESRIRMAEGIIAPVRRPDDMYLKIYNAATLRRYARNVLKVVGRNCSLLIEDILRGKGDEEFYKDYRMLAEKVLQNFCDFGNWDMPYWYGRSKQFDGFHQEALEAFGKARNCVLRDKKLPEEIRSNLLYVIDSSIAVSKGHGLDSVE